MTEIKNIKHDDYSDASNCRRYQMDRRVATLSIIERLLYRGERTLNRRTLDHQKFKYFDRHEPHLLLISITIMLCCLVDALLTLEILKAGGTELNYFADKLIGLGLYGFIFSKYLITAIGIIILVLHKHYQVFFGLQVRHALYGIVFLYISLIFYEVILITLSKNLG